MVINEDESEVPINSPPWKFPLVTLTYNISLAVSLYKTVPTAPESAPTIVVFLKNVLAVSLSVILTISPVLGAPANTVKPSSVIATEVPNLSPPSPFPCDLLIVFLSLCACVLVGLLNT